METFRRFTSFVSYLLCSLFVKVDLDGTIIKTGRSAFNVAGECCGFRYMTSMVAISLLSCLFGHKKLTDAFNIVLSSAFIGFILNVARIVSIVLFSVYFDNNEVVSMWHDISGYAFFLIGVMLVLRLED